jgi:rfaE bifunctional protein kinase chain/domain
MNRSRLEDLLSAISRARVAVVGDFCLDAYWMLDPSGSEISLETGKPTRPVRRQRYSLGGASNVAQNLAALGVGTVLTAGVIGEDLFGRELRRQLAAIGVDTDNLLARAQGWDTPVFGKPHAGDAEQERIDFGMFNRMSPEIEDELIERLRDLAARADALIVNQQLVNSIYTPRLIEEINRLIAAHPAKPFVVDSRQNPGAFRGACLKLNQFEAARLTGIDAIASGAEKRPERKRVPHDRTEQSRAAREACARRLFEKTAARAIFMTRGEHGILVCDAARCHEIQGIPADGPADPVGAGDTAAGALASALAAGATVEEAGVLANLAAAVTVRKLRQCGTASPKEILAILPNSS